MTKVLFIVGGLHVGGSENYLLRFIRYCGKDKFEWTALSVNTEKGDLHDEYIKAGCRVIYQSISYLNIGKFYQLYKWLKKENLDVVCTLNGNFGGIPLTVARLAGTHNRIAWHRRSTDAFGNNPFKKLYNKFVNQLLRWNATSILSNSNFALQNFYGRYRKNDPRFQVIYNSVNRQIVETSLSQKRARKKFNIPGHVFLVGNVGRFAPAKNHETIFKTALRLRSMNNNIRFLFCGRDTDNHDFKQRIKSYGIDDICYCLGIVDDIALVYKSLDLFFFPSVTEGQPNALIEAMLMNLPIVASDIPSIKEIIPEEFHSGILFNPEDVSSMRDAVISIKENDENKSNKDLYEYIKTEFGGDENFYKLLKEIKKCD